MIVRVDGVLTPEELNTIVSTLDGADFIDGKTTAGWHAKLVKNNTQLKSQVPYAQDLRELVKAALIRNTLFQASVQPKFIHSILFSRYEKGMSYGTHVDNALMGDQQFLRSDVSFTLFLNSPSSYEGGELVIEATDDERTYKLEAGSMIIYPSSTLHRVEPVTDGVRLVAVGWIQSLVRDPQEREILFDLDTVRRSIFAKEGKTIEFDLLSKCYANLLRKWVD
ncbi:MAG TPA: Fe2+-dependent dioxygenase [Cyanobacteria bacterium UBA8803]|nr:Fe2+-dependent dioxygenase [Cyanobacteria bacterium UBA9273]HBL59166.1 Fe2+-dependent dioxygenase [Cyanobacteria bacterium UBA8803]